MLNCFCFSPVYGSEFQLEQVLSDIRRDDNDDVISAGAASMRWVFQYNDTVDPDEDDRSVCLIDS